MQYCCHVTDEETDSEGLHTCSSLQLGVSGPARIQISIYVTQSMCSFKKADIGIRELIHALTRQRLSMRRGCSFHLTLILINIL